MKKIGLIFIIILLFSLNSLFAATLVSENIQTWTAHASSGNWTQAIPAGTVTMTACIVNPTSAASGTGTAGRVEMTSGTGILEIPSLSSIGVIEFHISTTNGSGRTVILQQYNGSSWVALTTFTGIGTTGATKTYTLNTTSATRIRLASADRNMYVHDIIITDFVRTINVVGSFTAFTTTVGTPSPYQSVALSGTNLNANINVAAVTGYQYATSTSGPWTSTLSLVQTFNGNVYVHLTGASVGSFPGTIAFTSTGATQVNKSVSGTVNPLGYPVHVNSNIPGVTVYQDAIAVGIAPYTSGLLTGSHTFGVMEVSTQVSPSDQVITVTSETTLTMNYSNPPLTIGGGGGGGSAIALAPGLISVPSIPGLTVNGTVEAPGVIVITKVTPGSKGTYHGYLHVSTVYQAWVSDVTMLNGGSLSFNYTPTTPNFVAIHWGGANNGYWPVDQPETIGVPTNGYAFNGAVSHFGYNLGMAPFSSSSYAGGILTINPIPLYEAKGSGTFEIILNGGDFDLPVELSSFNAVATAQMFVNLQWTTESETNNLGFNVYRSNSNNVGEASLVNFGIIGGTNTTTTHNYSFVDSSVDPETTYYYWLQMVDFDGTSHFSNSVMVTTNIQAPVQTVPEVTVMSSAYPNPFSSIAFTNIKVDVKRNETASLTIYNVLGQIVKSYILSQGSTLVTWNGRDDKGAICGSGVYFYKLSSPSVNMTRKMIIVK